MNRGCSCAGSPAATPGVSQLASLNLMAERNSSRVSGRVLNVPNKQLVSIVTPGLCTPLVVMHSCVASTITPTPYGFSTLFRHFAISAVIFS